MDAKTSNEPGRWKTSRTPYLRGIMDAFTDVDVEEVVFVKPTQVGGTECILNIIGFIVDQDPSPTMVVYPTERDAESITKNRLRTMIQKCAPLADKYDERASKLLELQFAGMFLALTGANTPSQLASRPIRFLLLDEVDKYPPRAGREADPISLARERTKTFSYNRKIFITSTPTYATGTVWQEFEKCETKLHFYLPCPHCGEYQRLRWRQVKYDNTLPTDSEKADTAVYVCAHCDAVITDADKADMLAAGEWYAEGGGSRQRLGLHLNALYSPWVTFRDVVAEWLKSKNTPETLMNFVNSWLAEPFEQVSSSADAERVLSCQSRYPRAVVPEETLRITGGVDKQRDRFYYTVRAWGENRRSWNIDHGEVRTEEELVEVFDRAYHDEQGRDWYVDLVLIDSGDDTGAVYDFCYLHPGLFVPVKGSSAALPSRYQFSVIEKEDTLARGMQLVRCDGGYYKDMIFRRLTAKHTQDWQVFDGCGEDYARQITAEHKVAKQRGGRTEMVWKPKTSGIDNHYLDCEVYAFCAADVMGGFDLLVSEEEQKPPAPAAPREEAPDTKGDDWLGGGEDWI